MQRDLQRKLIELDQRSTRLRQGVVTAVSPLTVRLGDGATPITGCKRLSSYVPTIGDTVRVEIGSGPLLVLGKIV